jgi:hypothetical protein
MEEGVSMDAVAGKGQPYRWSKDQGNHPVMTDFPGILFQMPNLSFF